MSVVAPAIPDFGQIVLNLYLIFYRFYYQNIHHSCIVSLRKPGSAGDDVVEHYCRQIICLLRQGGWVDGVFLSLPWRMIG